MRLHNIIKFLFSLRNLFITNLVIILLPFFISLSGAYGAEKDEFVDDFDEGE